MKGCRPLRDIEIDAVLDSFRGLNRSRDQALFTVALESGLRISCLISLKIEDVWDGDFLPHFCVRRVTVKGKRAGFISPMYPAAVVALKEYIERKCPRASRERAAFPFKQARPWRRVALARPHKRLAQLQARLQNERAFRMPGLRGKVACHSTRKTCARKVYAALGHDLFATKEAMHHASIGSTIPIPLV